MSTQTTTLKTVQTLRPGDTFTATAVNGVELTMTVAGEDHPLVTDDYPAVDVSGDHVWVTGVTGSARFWRGETAVVTV